MLAAGQQPAPLWMQCRIRPMPAGAPSPRAWTTFHRLRRREERAGVRGGERLDVASSGRVLDELEQTVEYAIEVVVDIDVVGTENTIAETLQVRGAGCVARSSGCAGATRGAARPSSTSSAGRARGWCAGVGSDACFGCPDRGRSTLPPLTLALSPFALKKRDGERGHGRRSLSELGTFPRPPSGSFRGIAAVEPHRPPARRRKPAQCLCAPPVVALPFRGWPG